MLLSWGPVLGRGTSKSVEQPLEKQITSQRLNMWLQLNFSLKFVFLVPRHACAVLRCLDIRLSSIAG